MFGFFLWAMKDLKDQQPFNRGEGSSEALMRTTKKFKTFLENIFIFIKNVVYLYYNLNLYFMASLTQITHEDLRTKLRNGSVKFFFRKVGGELRIAIGTLELMRVPSTQQPKGGVGPARCTSYFDLEIGRWRAISQTQEIWIE